MKVKKPKGNNSKNRWLLNNLSKLINSLNPKYLIISGIIILTAAIIANLKFPRLSISQINQGHSDAFYGRQIKDILKLSENSEEVEFSGQELKFQTGLPKIGNNLTLSFYFQCDMDCPNLWLTLIGESDAENQNALVFHPFLQDLNWFSVFDQGFYFYQKDLKYQNIDQFIKAKNNSQLLIQQYLAKKLKLNNQNLAFLETNPDITDFNNILTDFKKRDKNDGWYVFRQSFNIKGASVSETNKLTWILTKQGNPIRIKIAKLEAN